MELWVLSQVAAGKVGGTTLAPVVVIASSLFGAASYMLPSSKKNESVKILLNNKSSEALNSGLPLLHVRKGSHTELGQWLDSVDSQ